MKISASVHSSFQRHEVTVETENNRKSISITPKIEEIAEIHKTLRQGIDLRKEIIERIE